ncbi:AIM24 family protein [Metabacillus idriensis]|uniref:AIM24 family protein n=1 Tax=Metabacillus idriensis TaxID=324768 RepID=UPI00174B5BBC|nr:AIM24 family protein [Metabacillus idriensis]
MNRYSIEEFVEKTVQQDKGQGLFELETERLLEINLNGQIWAKAGAMVSYRGHIKYEREGILEHGIGKLFKKAFTGEGTSLMKATGSGKLYLADQGKKISILNLNGETLFVNGNDLLAFEPSILWDIKMMRKIAGMLSGGLFNVKLEGRGMIAITSHYEPLTLIVKQGDTVYTDPNATVAWSGSLTPEFVTDISFKTFLGRGSGESIQMKFSGEGFVVVQPYEEVYFRDTTS